MLHSVARSSTERRSSRSTKLHAAVQGQFFSSVIGEDGKDDVLCRAAVVKLADEFEAIDSGTLTKVKPALTRLAWVAPTPHVRALEAPPMQV